MSSLNLDPSILENKKNGIKSLKVPFILNGKPYLLSYRPSGKETDIYEILTNKNNFRHVISLNWSSGFTSIVPFYLNNQSYLFLYKFNGEATMIDRILPGGKGTKTTSPDLNWAPGWGSVTLINIGGQPHLLSYKSDNTKIDLDKILPKGKGTKNVWSRKIEIEDASEKFPEY